MHEVTDGEELLRIMEIVREIPVAKASSEFALKLVLATHPEMDYARILLKIYPLWFQSSGAQAVIATAKIRALLEGRYNVAFEDIRYTAYPALRHRIFLNFEGLSEGLTTDKMISEIIKELDETL